MALGSYFETLWGDAKRASRFITTGHRWVAILALVVAIALYQAKDSKLDELRLTKAKAESARINFLIQQGQFFTLGEIQFDDSNLFTAIYNTTADQSKEPHFAVLRAQGKLIERRNTLFLRSSVLQRAASATVTLLDVVEPSSPDRAKVTEAQVVLAGADKVFGGTVDFNQASETDVNARLVRYEHEIETQNQQLSSIIDGSLSTATNEIADDDHAIAKLESRVRWLLLLSWLLSGAALLFKSDAVELATE